MRNTSCRLAAAAAIALLAAGCSSSTEPFADPAALAASVTFDRIADSLYAAGADPGVSSAYHEIARVLRGGPALTSVVISVDGVPADYLATALSFDQNYCPPDAICASIYRTPLNSMIAWQRSDPRRIVQLTAGDAAVPTRTSFGPTTLIYLDGAGGVYLGWSGTQSIRATPTEQRCAVPAAPPESSYLMPSLACFAATFDVSFDATVQWPLVALRDNTATGTHTIAMAEQTVSGTKLFRLPCTDGCVGDPPALRPPVAIGANNSALQSGLRTTVVERNVTLELMVKNISPAPVQIDFDSAQQYDFIVRSFASGAVVWQWSANKSFGQSLGSRTLAPGETVVFSEPWNAAAAGNYLIQALLTSRSHRAAASASIDVR